MLPQQFVATDTEQSIVGQQISISYTLKYNDQEEVQTPIVRDLKEIVTGHAGWGINKKRRIKKQYKLAGEFGKVKSLVRKIYKRNTETQKEL